MEGITGITESHFTRVKPLSFPESFTQIDSGYNSLQNTPEEEQEIEKFHFREVQVEDFPKLPEQDLPSKVYLDWGILCKELDNLLVSSPLEKVTAAKVLQPEGIIFANSPCTFSIDGLEDQDAYEFATLSIDVKAPSGYSYPIQVKTDYSTLTCTFKPLEIGVHEGSVLSGDKHIRGSPFSTLVHRDYASIEKPVTSLDIEIIAGQEGDGNETDPMSQIQIRKPWGIACDLKTENIIVADRERHEILLFSPDGELNFTFGKRGSGPKEFYRPTSVAHDSTKGRILVGDKDNHRIQVFNDGGDFLFAFGTRGYRTGQFLYPWGIAVSKCGEMIVVADTRNHRIQLFNSNGAYLRQFPQRQIKSEFNHPRGVAFDLEGENIYVSDFNLNCIFKVNIQFTTYTKIVKENLKRPQGLCVDAGGNLLVADSRNNRIQVFSPDGTPLQEFNKFSNNSPMDLPLDLALMGAGYLAVLDLNGRVNVI